MSAANALLKVIHVRLSGDPALTAMTGADGIVDRLLPRAALPCVVIADLDSREHSTSTERGQEHFLTLQIWCEAGGRRVLNDIADRVVALLDDALLALEDDVLLVNLQHRSTRTGREAKTRHHRADVRFRAVTE
jgi:hypothetical protein